jgi:hypothetical protein
MEQRLHNGKSHSNEQTNSITVVVDPLTTIKIMQAQMYPPYLQQPFYYQCLNPDFHDHPNNDHYHRMPLETLLPRIKSI